jgi:hypothetical protein
LKSEGNPPRIEEILSRVLRAEDKASEVLKDKEAASLGDAYLNLAYSLAQSLREGKPKGLRLDNRVLAEAVKKAGLRSKLPKRLSRREIGGAAEALLAYAAARGMLSTWELIEELAVGDRESLAEALAKLLSEAYRRLEEAEKG